MISREPKIWDLELEDRVNIRPREDARLKIKFLAESDLANLEFRLDADQDPWPMQTRPLHVIDSQSWDFDDAIFVKDGATLFITIPWDRMQTWVDVKMECQINARTINTTSEWVVADFSITVARGE